MDDSCNLEETRIIIKTERDYCYKINLELLTQCKEHKKILDMRYDDIYKFLTYIQTSIIILSTISSFIQALGSDIYISDKLQFIVSLLITTYISLILSLAKFFKLEEKKESIHNLREKFAELHNKIRYRLDNLKPWGSPDFVNDNDCKTKYESWESEKANTYNDYYKIIEGKQALFMEFEKLIDSRLKNKYLVLLNYDLKQKEKIKKRTCNLESLIQRDIELNNSRRLINSIENSHNTKSVEINDNINDNINDISPINDSSEEGL